jgi:dethiobiotin synthetase
MPPANSAPGTHGVFLTGTDTGVGKTFVAVALLRALAAQGVCAAGMKPVAAGVLPGAACNADVEALALADGLPLALRDRNPYAFAPAIAPHLAAAEAGSRIELEVIAAAWQRVRAAAAAVVVEGAGGVMVPLDERHDMLDIAVRLDLPVLLVVGLRLGCINHALLSAQAVRARGLRLVGWVANELDPAMLRIEANIESIGARIGMPPAAILRWNMTEIDASTALDKLAHAILSTLLDERRR